MANDWSANLLPSPSTTSNLKAKLPPCSPGAWLYSMCPIKRRKTKTNQQTNKQKTEDLLLVCLLFISEVRGGTPGGLHLPHLIPF